CCRLSQSFAYGTPISRREPKLVNAPTLARNDECSKSAIARTEPRDDWTGIRRLLTLGLDASLSSCSRRDLDRHSLRHVSLADGQRGGPVAIAGGRLARPRTGRVQPAPLAHARRPTPSSEGMAIPTRKKNGRPAADFDFLNEGARHGLRDSGTLCGIGA